MKKCYFILLMSLLLAGCKKTGDCVIPKNVRIVASVDFVGLAEETDLVDSSIYDIICRFMKADPLEIGIDFREPIMLFQLADGSVCTSLAIDDEEKLTDCLTDYARDNIATLPKENGGLTWSKVLGEAQLAYNGNTLLILMNKEGSESHAKDIMRQLFSLKYEDSFYSTKDYERMEDFKGKDVVIYANLSALPDNVVDIYKMILPEGVKCSDIETVSFINSEDGQMVVKSEVFSDDEKAQAMLNEHECAIKSISGEYLESIPKEAIVTVMAGIEGCKIYEIIKRVPDLSKQISMAELASGLDIGNKIKNAKNDMMLCMDEEEPFCIWLDGEELSISDKWKKTVVEPLPASKDEVTKYSLFVYVDLEKVDNRSFSGGIPIPSVYKCANELRAVTIRSEGKGDLTIILHSNNKENFLKQLL